VVATARSSALPATGTPAATVHLGAELFFTGPRTGGRMARESWGTCILCHPDGLTDNTTWMFDTGPRQTIPLDGMFDRNNTHNQRVLNWSAVRDENQDFELNTRGVFGGEGPDRGRSARCSSWRHGRHVPNDSDAVLQYHQFLNTVTTTNVLAGDAPLAEGAGERPRLRAGDAA
jgi:hypothetical protein